MKNEIINFLSNVNYAFVSLVFVSFVLSFLFLCKRKVSLYLKEIYIVFFASIAWIGFYLYNDIFNKIFELNYFNVKLYLLLLIIGNVITIVNINFVKKISFKILNYLMFMSNFFIFVFIFCLFVGNRLSVLDVSIQWIIKLMNINFMIFLLYLNLISYVSLGYNIKKLLLSRRKEIKEEISSFVDEELLDSEDCYENEYVDTNFNSININDNSFIIDGVDCGVIFDDEDKNEVLINYYILLNDVNAKLLNGYTIHEYKKIKDIINRLNIKDLNRIKLDINKLSMITYDEYNLLKRYFKSKNIKI